jgi:hypothetical protein
MNRIDYVRLVRRDETRAEPSGCDGRAVEVREWASFRPQRVEHVVDLPTDIDRFVAVGIVRASSVSRNATSASSLSKK